MVQFFKARIIKFSGISVYIDSTVLR